MQLSPTSLTQPQQFKQFTFPGIEFRGFTNTTQSSNLPFIGETSDITQNVQNYSLNDGKLTVRLKDGVLLVRKSNGDHDIEASKALHATEAVLNQLGITIFEKFLAEYNQQTETIGLLCGNKFTRPPITYCRIKGL